MNFKESGGFCDLFEQLSRHLADKSQIISLRMVCCFVFGATAPNGPGPPHSRGFKITHNDASQSVGLLWTSDQLVAETSDNIQQSQQTNIHGPGGIRTHNLSSRAAADPRLRPRCHWHRHIEWLSFRNFYRLLFLWKGDEVVAIVLTFSVYKLLPEPVLWGKSDMCIYRVIV